MAGLQSGPAIPISRHAHASLGLPASAGVSVARDNGSIRDLQEWVNKALLSYEGKWLESAMDFLHNLLVGSTEAMAWCLECCYHTNRFRVSGFGFRVSGFGFRSAATTPTGWCLVASGSILW
jgi:hypothetical protein